MEKNFPQIYFLGVKTEGRADFDYPIQTFRLSLLLKEELGPTFGGLDKELQEQIRAMLQPFYEREESHIDSKSITKSLA